MVEIESRRLVEQERLDRLEEVEEGNRLGQFATRRRWRSTSPDMRPHGGRAALTKSRSSTRRLGTGSFYSAMRQAFPAGRIADACGVELDPGLRRGCGAPLE